jgi:hypothetical protein
MDDGEQQKVRTCRACGGDISGHNIQALHCSERCRNRYRERTRKRKRNQRKRNPAYWARAKARALELRKERHRKRALRKLEQNRKRVLYEQQQQALSEQRQCRECGGDLTGCHWQAWYCSNTCRNRRDRRKYETRMRNNPTLRQRDLEKRREYAHKKYNKWRREIYVHFSEDQKLLFNARRRMLEGTAAGKEQKLARYHRAETKRRAVIQALRELGWLANDSLMAYVGRVIARQLDELEIKYRLRTRDEHGRWKPDDPIYRKNRARLRSRVYARRKWEADSEGMREKQRIADAKNRGKYRDRGDRSGNTREKERTIIRAMRELGWLQGYDIQIPDEGLKR